MSIIFRFIIFSWNFVVMLKKTRDLNLAQNKFSPLAIGIWAVFLCIIKSLLIHSQVDVICISETYLDSDTSREEPNLERVGYTLIKADHPSNTKRGGACLYYRNSLVHQLLNIQYLEECINFETSLAGKACNFVSLCRSPIQLHYIPEKFADNLELNLDTIANKNRYLIFILGDFNAKSSNWCKFDKTTDEGSRIEAITSQFGLKQLIQEPKHILSNSPSCIDLVFTS